MDLTKQTELIDTSEITRIVDDYFRALDEKDFTKSRMEHIFSQDATIVRPNGAPTKGPEMIGKSHAESFARFRGSQHLVSNHAVTLSGDNADFRANLVALHLWKDTVDEANLLNSSFIAGGVITGQAVRTKEGWKISRLANRVVWRAGTGFESILNTGK